MERYGLLGFWLRAPGSSGFYTEAEVSVIVPGSDDEGNGGTGGGSQPEAGGGAPTTDVGYGIEAPDSADRQTPVREYRKEPGSPALAITDLTAFPDARGR